ncbi:hypothetical protein [Kineococcus radiotolerans]|uniref:Uncharacterized protein n=1 Tax=Kineococcus radiotolerans (strain ATCC BAA-149 / DSM 14245 / SRS30216) TaxID=266940 RepID=A6W8U3_KINRD|nr:hypothetical protein [Kineococcus radiotolerans]ABS03232.1 hypothetical protein Krad_1746 [Kineococcus radiotolerans SRS30216 = ATCC BAA-149]
MTQAPRWMALTSTPTPIGELRLATGEVYELRVHEVEQVLHRDADELQVTLRAMGTGAPDGPAPRFFGGVANHRLTRVNDDLLRARIPMDSPIARAAIAALTTQEPPRG